MALSRSEFFRAKHGDYEINEAAERDEADDDVFHVRKVAKAVKLAGRPLRFLAYLVAEAYVRRARGEEADRYGNEDDVVHAASILRNRGAD